MGSSSHRGYIIVPGQEANMDIFDALWNNGMLSVFIRIASKKRF